MAKITFQPNNIQVDVEPRTKVLAAAIRNKVDLRFGCASCRCGTCGIKILQNAETIPMKDDEIALLGRMKLPTDGTIRLACQTRVLSGELVVDLDFQNQYSPDQGDTDEG